MSNLTEKSDRAEPATATTEPEVTPMEAAAEVRRLGQGIWVSSILQTAAQLRLADCIEDEPMPVEELAAKAGVDEHALIRLLRALAAHGVFADVGGQRYRHTEYSRALRVDNPHSVRSLLLLAASEWNWAVWQNLPGNVTTGNAAFTEHYGKDLYRYFAEDDPGAGAVFDESMSEAGKWSSIPIARMLDLTDVRVIADVGGGQGGLLRTVLERNPLLGGVLIDRDQVVAQADPVLLAGQLADRTQVIAADIRLEVPASADLYLLRQVMHIWDDETCVRILRNCVDRAVPGARVVMIEHVLSDGPQPNSPFSTLIDLVMMLIGSGRERTTEEFAELAQQAGLEFLGVRRGAMPFGLIETKLPG
ncbi:MULTISPECIES: methyltransferase [unclassified Nocardia]|uniref:methyltransferase n=1 Tax=unclassified Nocardia TaxID=2637762 RepID=UPI0035D8CF85